MAALMSLAALMNYSVADAQSEGNWLETALEKTRSLSSPWEVPTMPQRDSGPLPESTSLGPDNPPETKIVLEVPRGHTVRTEPSESTSTESFVVRFVDDFEDPWGDDVQHENAEKPGTAHRGSLEGGSQMNPASAEIRELEDPSTRRKLSREDSFELTDPWAD